MVSRLRSGSGFIIGQPAPAELSAILYLMAKQRGIKLTEQGVKFLERRLPPTIQDIEAFLERALQVAAISGRKINHTLLSDAL